jgi:hypothetical protein
VLLEAKLAELSGTLTAVLRDGPRPSKNRHLAGAPNDQELTLSGTGQVRLVDDVPGTRCNSSSTSPSSTADRRGPTFDILNDLVRRAWSG